MAREIVYLRDEPRPGLKGVKAEFMGADTIIVLCPRCGKSIIIQAKEAEKACWACGAVVGDKPADLEMKVPRYGFMTSR